MYVSENNNDNNKCCLISYKTVRHLKHELIFHDSLNGFNQQVRQLKTMSKFLPQLLYTHIHTHTHRLILAGRQRDAHKCREIDSKTNKHRSRLVFTARLRPKLLTPPVRNAPELRSLYTAAPPVQSEYSADRRAAAAVPLPESP